MRLIASFTLIIVSGAAALSAAPSARDAEQHLRQVIAATLAIDNHAHPQCLAPADQPDNDYDQLPSPLPDFPLPVRLRPDNPQFIQAWQALYRYPYHDVSAPHFEALKKLRAGAMAAQGDNYPGWILRQIGTDVMIANRVQMGRGLTTPHFRWVAFADALAMPFHHTALAARTPDREVYFGDVERLTQRYLAALGVSGWPATMSEYLLKVVTATLERQKKDGAIGIKFEAAYLRSLNFADVPRARAEQIYAQGLAGPLSRDDDTALQDFLYHYLAHEAGRLELPVQIHVGPGVGGHLLQQGAQPFQLETLLEDPGAAKTKFVLLHGAWPFPDEVQALLSKPNVYADFSAQTFLLFPPALARNIRGWLNFIPEKVLYGTDALPPGPEMGWEEIAWLTAKTGREALTLALLDMVRNGEVTPARAEELAHAVLRDNAIAVYGPRLLGK